MADEYTLQPAMDACIRETATTGEQATGRAAFGAAGQADLDLAEADIATNAADIATNAGDIATNAANIAANTADIANATIWMGEWPSGGTTALERQQYRDGEWLAIANATTTDRPAPQPSGPVVSELPDEPAWSSVSHTGVIRSDTSYLFNVGGWVNRFQVWVPDVDPAIDYQLVIVDITDPAAPVSEIFPLPALTANAWTTVAVRQSVITAGANLIVSLSSSNSSSVTQNSSQWTAGGEDIGAAPATGQWNYRAQQDELRINYTDGNAVDQTALLNSIIPGSTIKCSQANDPNNYFLYNVIGSVDMGTAREFSVTLVETGSTGGPADAEVCDIQFDVPVHDSTEAVTIPGQWAAGDPSWATIDSQLYFSDVQQSSDGAFGHRIDFQPAYISPDWDFQASLLASGGSSGGSGVTVGHVEALRAESYVDQDPTGLGVPLQLTLGAAQTTEYFDLDALGNITCLQADDYDMTIKLTTGREGTTGESQIYARMLVDGVQAGPSTHVILDSDKFELPAIYTGVVSLLPGEVVTMQIIRDTDGIDSGGVKAGNPAVAGWNPSPSVSIILRRVYTK